MNNSGGLDGTKVPDNLSFTPTNEEYTSEAIFQKEIEKVFHRQWLLVGHISQVKNNGDFYVKSVGAESLIISRDSKGELRAYFNLCRHRGYRIKEDFETGCEARGFVCPYHQWSYSIDGELKNVQGAKDQEFFNFSDYPLHEAFIDSVHGWIYVWLGREEPPALKDWLGSIVNDQKLADFGSSQLKQVHRQVYQINANWKAMMENDSECYHCGYGGHPSLAISCSWREFFADAMDPERPFPLREAMKTFSMDGDYVCKKKLGKGMPDGLSTGIISGPYFDAVGLFVDYAMSMELTPVSVNESLFIVEWWVHEDAIEGVDYESGEKVAEVFHVTTLEDKAFGERNFRGLQSSRHEPGPLHPLRENGVIGMYDMYRKLMAD